jgi:hypothetical protein
VINKALVLCSNSHLCYMAPRSVRDNPRYGIAGELSSAYVLKELGEGTTRLILRTRASYGPRLYRALTLPFILIGGGLLTERMTLHGIKKRAERAATQTAKPS